ncbi:MAG TPA: fumarylacetoacetate hydrolase family protein [Burkholderiales bacterium]|nr:fumarylacetoacetate hydrolase family protein [Burkholderiales bacterium]
MRLRKPFGPESRFEQAARWLHEAHLRREPFAPLPDPLVPQSIEDAYAVQAGFVSLRHADRGAVAGYKVAITSETMRRMTGLKDPVAGDMLEKTLHRGPAKVRAADFVRLIVEFEVAVEIAQDLPAVDAPYTRESVAKSVGAVMPALELADDRNADYSLLASHPLMLIADNAWNEGAVLGEPVQDWQQLDLAALVGVATLDGKRVGEGRGAHVMGHPFESLAWLANNLASRGLGLWRSDVVITGSMVASVFPQPGQTVRFDAGPLGSVVLQVD